MHRLEEFGYKNMASTSTNCVPTMIAKGYNYKTFCLIVSTALAFIDQIKTDELYGFYVKTTGLSGLR